LICACAQQQHARRRQHGENHQRDQQFDQGKAALTAVPDISGSGTPDPAGWRGR
jgi:hypothetical protein